MIPIIRLHRLILAAIMIAGAVGFGEFATKAIANGAAAAAHRDARAW